MGTGIPDDLLVNIGERLNTKTDVSRFRAVCKSWRSLIPPFEKRFPIPVSWWDNEFTLSESVVYHLAPPVDDDPHERGWLIKVREGGSGKTLMVDPLSQLEVKVDLFPESFPEALNLLDYRVFEVAKAYHISEVKVAMSVDLDEFPVFMMISDHGELHYGKLGVEDEKKSTEISHLSGDCFDKRFEDVIFYKGEFYAVSTDSQIVVVDSSLNGMVFEPKIERSPWYQFSGCNKVSRNLVESDGVLLLVDRYLSKKRGHPPEFKVYKLSADKKEWHELEEEALSDRILILGENFCYSVCSRDFPGYKGNCIYFSTLGKGGRQLKWKYDLEGTFRDIGVRGLRNNRCLRLESCTSFENIFYPPKTHLSILKARRNSWFYASREFVFW